MPADPLDALRLPLAPLAPDPAFADRLRRRLVDALLPMLVQHNPEEPTVTSIDTSVAAPTITAAVVCDDARGLIRWMVDVLEFQVAELHEGPDGSVVHARLSWRTGNVFVADRHPGPWSETGPVNLCLAADSAAEIDRLYAKARAAGTDVIAELSDADYGSHQFGVRDPAGNLWSVGTYRPPVGPT